MSFPYIVKEGYSGFKRTPLATLTSIVALTIPVILIGIIGRFYYSAADIGSAMQHDIEIEAFLEEVSVQRQQAIRHVLSALPIVASVDDGSKDSAAAAFRVLFGAGGP